MFPRATFVLGGAASGKSAYAEDLVLRSGGAPVYIATAQAFDAEMTEKIAIHRDRRGPEWRTVEAPLDLPEAVAARKSGEAVLLDCLTLWLTNVLLADRDVPAEIDRLCDALAGAPGPIVVVSNEVGAGIVPADALSRRFRAEQGQLNQRVAAQSDVVVAVMAGLPLALKGTLP